MNTRSITQVLALLTIALVSMWACAETVSAEYEAVLEGKNTLVDGMKEDTAVLSTAFLAKALKSGAITVDFNRNDLNALIPRNQMITLSPQTMCGTLSPEQGIYLDKKRDDGGDSGK